MVEREHTNESERIPHIPVPVESIGTKFRVAELLSNANDKNIPVWKHGAELYRAFIKMIGDDQLRERYADDDELKLVFLGEKPAIWGSRERFLPIKGQLEQFGLVIEGQFLFNPVAVEEMFRRYPDEFAGLPTKSPTALIKAMDKVPITEGFVPRGLLMGYPLTACKNFPPPQSDSRKPLRGVPGLDWVDNTGFPDSQEKETRLRQALEASGFA
ncbi:MAG: hypothetical protein HOO67_01440 [Candidatus Peribacteraceae bacterium]|nr:hypothetical protein [Candidatus Peribacteraceae bacterium]